jgi:RNA polymerase sigma-70 factor, ECF subfamily
MKRVQQGERSAFDALVIKYQHKILGLVMRYVQDPSEALDVTQGAFLRAYRAAPSFPGDSAFYTWLYRVACNTAKNYLQSLGRRPMLSGLDPQDAEHLDTLAKLKDLDTPEGLTLSDEIRETVAKAVADMPEALRTALLLKELEDLSYAQIAEIMRCPVGTVRSRIFRAREAIDARIGPLLD